MFGRSADNGKGICVIALGLVGAFDKVWHIKASLFNLGTLGICSNLLNLLQDCPQGGPLRVALEGYTPGERAPLECQFPRRVFGTLLRDIYFNNILQLTPGAHLDAGG